MVKNDIQAMTQETFNLESECEKDLPQGSEDLEAYFESKSREEGQSAKHLISKGNGDKFGFQNSRIQAVQININDALKLFDENQVVCYTGFFVDEIQCFRFTAGGQVVDFPRNWSLFVDIFSWIRASRGDGILHLTDDLDQSKLLVALSSLGKSVNDAIFIIKAKSLYLLLFSKTERKLLDFLFQSMGIQVFSERDGVNSQTKEAC